jgi:hypothetical protein
MMTIIVDFTRNEYLYFTGRWFNLNLFEVDRFRSSRSQHRYRFKVSRFPFWHNLYFTGTLPQQATWLRMPSRHMIIFEAFNGITGCIVTLDNAAGTRFYDWLDQNMWDFQITLQRIVDETIHS